MIPALMRLLLAVVFAAGISGIASTSTRAASLPGYFGIGLQNAPNDVWWMTSSGVPWTYRYQYINPGWEYWNFPAGSFAANYTAQSLADGYVPVFTWYELGGAGIGGWNLNYLAGSGNMYTYYSDFVLLLQQIAAAATSGQPVIVHLEPDLWGFMQQFMGDDPTVIPVSVASSGYPGLGGLPNTAAGFAQAFVQLRNTYAPNVLLAWHASMWGANNGYDPTLSNPDWYQTPQATGALIGAFYSRLGASFDLIFHDVSDADSAYKVLVRGQSSGSAWWSTDAFSSFQQYLGAVYQATGVKSMLWQVPIGNTLYLSVNNTPYHYQDNRAQYFLSPGNTQNILSYAAQGVIGLLFGGGPWAATDYMDQANDGITNPPAVDGNNLVASYSDDDGGFLRTATAAYYAAGPVVTGGPIQSSSSLSRGAHDRR